MNRVYSTAAIVAAIVLSGSAAQAASKTFVRAGGTDSGACPATTPCASLSYAYDQTTAGGELFCLSAGGYGPLYISKSITVDCRGTGGTPGWGLNTGFIDINTAPSDRVVLRGLEFQSTTGAGSNFAGSGTLILDQVRIGGDGTNGNSALSVEPNGPAKIVVVDSLFINGGGNSSGAGIRIFPQAGGTAQVTLNRVTASGNAFGIAIDGSSSTGGINVTISDSVMASNANDGIVATSSAGTAPIGVLLSNVRSTNNGYGVRSIGSNVTVRVDNSRIAGNGVGISGGGALLSAGNNIVEANGTNGAFTGAINFK